MKRTPLAIAISSILLAGAVQAEDSPYAAWQQSSDDDVTIKTDESFNRDYSVREDNDVSKVIKKDIDITKTRTEDNDFTYTKDIDITKKHSEDNDFALDLYQDNDVTKTRTEDNDIALDFKQDNDWTYTSSEDNDVTKSWDADIDVDSQHAASTQDVHKYQDQYAGHQGQSSAQGYAEGHDTSVYGGQTKVAAGNDENLNFGTQISNVNQMPTNYLFVGGSNMAPIDQTNQSAGRDLGSKGVFAPVGNVGVEVLGNTGNHTSSGVDQSGSASNGIKDGVYSDIRR